MNQKQDQAGTSAIDSTKDRSVRDEVAAGKGKLADLAQTATSAGKAQLDSGLVKAADQVETLAHAMDDAASRLKEGDQEGLASFATHIASSITTLADRLRDRSVDDLTRDARELAHKNPALFLAGSVAVGFGLTRFLKASSRISGVDGHQRQDQYGNAYGDSRSSGDSLRSGSSYDSSGSGSPYTSGGSSAPGGSSTSGGSAWGGEDRTTSSGQTTPATGASGSAAGRDSGSPSTFPEMGTASVKSDGSVGGTRTNQTGGGSHG